MTFPRANSEPTPSGFAILGGTIAFLVLLVGGVLLGGFVLSTLWSWLVVPIFALPVLTLGQAIAVSVIWQYLNYGHTSMLTEIHQATVSNGDIGELMFNAGFKMIFSAGLFLLFGWIATNFI